MVSYDLTAAATDLLQCAESAEPSPKRMHKSTLALPIWICLTVFAFSCASPDSEPRTDPESSDAEDVERVNPEERIDELGIYLRQIGEPPNNFLTAVQVDNKLYLSGRGPVKEDGGFVTGKLGRDLTVEEGYEAARLTGIDLLAALKSEIGDLNRVRQIVKVLGVVNAEPDFTEHPQVINGFSDLMVEVFGERGRHARSALGMGSLPFGIPVEIEMIVLLED